MGKILNQFTLWCGSFTGKVILFVLAVMAVRVLLSYLREKYGKKSQLYKNIKALIFLVYGLITINMITSSIGGVFAKIAGIGGLIPWSLAMILAYIIVTAITFFRARTVESLRPFWVAWGAVILCVIITQSNTQNGARQVTGETIFIGIIFSIITALIMTGTGDLIRNKEKQQNEEDARWKRLVAEEEKLEKTQKTLRKVISKEYEQKYSLELDKAKRDIEAKYRVMFQRAIEKSYRDDEDMIIALQRFTEEERKFRKDYEKKFNTLMEEHKSDLDAIYEDKYCRALAGGPEALEKELKRLRNEEYGKEEKSMNFKESTTKTQEEERATFTEAAKETEEKAPFTGAEDRSADTKEEKSSAKDGRFKVSGKGILWAVSVVAAYLAGEFSLLPKLASFFKQLFSRQTDGREAYADGDVVDKDGNVLNHTSVQVRD